MKPDRDIERLLDRWFSDGPDQAPDRVIDVVADRIGRQSQRPARRLQRRSLDVNTYSKIALAAAAVLVVALVGYNLLPAGSTGVGGPAPSPSPTASLPPTATPTGTAVASGAPVALYDGVLAAGRYRIQPFRFTDLPSLSIVADIPAGWIGYPGVPGFTSPGGSNEGALIGFMRADGLFRDPCRWDLDGTGSKSQPGDVVVGPTVDDLVAALQANTSYTSSTPTPVTLGAFEGFELQLQLPGDDVLSTCDREPGSDSGQYFVFSGKDGGFYSQGPDSRWQLSIVDVVGTRLIALVSYFETTPQADLAAAQAIMDSIQITP